MAWTISTSSGTTTITPDGTSDADLSVLLDSAISAGQSGISSPAAGIYAVTNNLTFAADPNGASGTKWLYCSGMTLHHSGIFLRNLNSRLKITNKNAAGAVVGRFTQVVYRNPTDYPDTAAIIRVSSGAGATTIQADSWDLTWKSPTGTFPTGSVVLGGGINSRQSGTISGCTFIFQNTSTNSWTDHGMTIDVGTVYSNNFFKGLGYIELSNDCPVFLNNTIEDINLFYGSELSASYLEGISSPDFTIYSDYPGYLQDCDITATRFQRIFLGSNSAIVFRNSIEFLGTSSEGSGLFVVRLADNSQVYKRTCDSSGNISGGNEKGLTTSSTSSERLLIDVATKTYDGAATGNTFTTGVFVTDYRGIWEAVFVKYGRLPQTFSFDLQGTLATKQSIPFGSLVDSYITVSNTATVAGYTQYTITHSTSTVSISGSNTQRQFHDYSALEKSSFADSGVTTGGNPVPKCCLPSLATRIYERSTGLCLYNLVIANSASVPTGTDGIGMDSGKNITLSATGDYSAVPIIVSSTSTITVKGGGTTDLRSWTIPSGATINRDTGSATVIVASTSGITAGTGVTLQTPPINFSAANINNNGFDNVRCRTSWYKRISFTTTEVNTTTNRLTLSGVSGKITQNTIVRLAGTDLPSPLQPDEVYYPYTISGDAFSLSGTPGGVGSEIDLTDTGSGSMVAIVTTELDIQLVTSGGYSFSLNQAAATKGITLASGDTLLFQAIPWKGSLQGVSPAVAGRYHEEFQLYSGSSVSTLTELEAYSEHDTFSIQEATDGYEISQLTVTGSSPTRYQWRVDASAPGRVQIESEDPDRIISTRWAVLFFQYMQWTIPGIRLFRGQIEAENLNSVVIKSPEVGVDADLTVESFPAGIPLLVNGPGMYRSDGKTWIATGSPIQHQPDALVAVPIEVEIPVNLSSEVMQLLHSIAAGAAIASSKSAPDNDSIATVLTNTNRVNALIENSGGDRFTAKALESAPVSPGTSAAQIWDYLTSSISTAGSVGKLIKDNLDAAVSSRSTYAGGDTAGTTTLLSRLTSGRASNLDNLDAAISTRSTYTGSDTPGTTTLLSRLTSTRAGYLDNLSGGAVMLASSYTAPDNSGITAIKAQTDLLTFSGGNVNAISTNTTSITSAVWGYSGTIAANITSQLQGFGSSDRTALLSAQSAALAVADGGQKINYLASTFTIYNSDGSTRKVFDLKDQDGNAATSAQSAVGRIPQ